MITVYSSKPDLSRRISAQLSIKYPQQKIVYIHSMYFVNVYFNYPENIKWKDFPFLKKPAFKIKGIENWRATTLIDGNLEPTYVSSADIINSEKIIYAADPGSTDTYLFSEFILKAFDKPVADMTIDALKIFSLSTEDIEQSINNISNFSTTFKFSVEEGKIKKYFDYNFNFNSLALFGKTYKYINKSFNDEPFPKNDFGNIFISKVMLPLLYFIREKQRSNINYRQGSLCSQMSSWKGTRKYTFSVKIGRPSSIVQIIENLVQLKLIKYHNNLIFITAKGEQFLDFLPKNCMDYDLPFRIELWARMPFSEAKIKIDKYLYTYFKKVKNKLKFLENNSAK